MKKLLLAALFICLTTPAFCQDTPTPTVTETPTNIVPTPTNTVPTATPTSTVPTATPTPTTHTYTPTRTYSFTRTFTRTKTSTFTTIPTPTISNTFTATPTKTYTPTNTNVAHGSGVVQHTHLTQGVSMCEVAWIAGVSGTVINTPAILGLIQNVLLESDSNTTVTLKLGDVDLLYGRGVLAAGITTYIEPCPTQWSRPAAVYDALVISASNTPATTGRIRIYYSN
jgi:hypothetical protein